MIRVTIEVEEYGDDLTVVKDNSAGTDSEQPMERLRQLVAEAEASALAAMGATPE